MSQLTPGFYTCEVIEGRVREAESGAKSVCLALQPKGRWDASYENDGDEKTIGAFVGPADGDWPRAFGDWYFVKANGELNPTGFDQLIRAGCWLDKFEDWDAAAPDIARTVIVEFKDETYQNKITCKASWLHPANHRPGQGGIAKRADRERLMAIEGQYGGQLRAMAADFRSKQKA